MRSGLFFKLLNPKPCILLNQKFLFNYTFLQSSHLENSLKSDPTTHTNKSLIEFLKIPFTEKDLNSSQVVKQKSSQHAQLTNKIYNSLRKQKDKLIQNVFELVNHNIIDTQVWIKVFAQLLQLRYDQFKDHPQMSDIYLQLQGYFSKFDTNKFKFYLDEKEAIGMLTKRQKSTFMFEKSRKLSNIQLQTNMISFFTKASQKTQIDLLTLRKYYKEIIQQPSFQQNYIKQQQSILDLAKFQSKLDRIQLAKKQLRNFISNRFKELVPSDQKIELKNNDQYLELLKTWSVIGEMRPQYNKILPQIIDKLIDNHPELLLEAIVACKVETQQNIERILDELVNKPIQTLQNPQIVHRILHILIIKDFDLFKYSTFTKSLCDNNCSHISPIISSVLTSPIVSNCMKSKSKKTPQQDGYSIQVKNMLHMTKNTFPDQYKVFYRLKICQFLVDFGFVYKNKVNIVNIVNLNKATNKPKKSRVFLRQMNQLFSFYGIKIIQLDTSYKLLIKILSKKKDSLTKQILNQLEHKSKK